MRGFVTWAIGLGVLAQLMGMAAKVSGHVDWSWWVVLTPTWTLLACALAVFALLACELAVFALHVGLTVALFEEEDGPHA